jgi:alpha-L-fucosidase
MKRVFLALLACGLFVSISQAEPPRWKNPLEKRGYLNNPLVEVTPFVFNERLYLLENHQGMFDHPGAAPTQYTDEGCVRIRDVESGKLVCELLKKHSFGTVFVWKGEAIIFASDYRASDSRSARQISMVRSRDLQSWSEPRTVFVGQAGETIYNLGVCRGPDHFVLLYETDDRQFTPFTFKYCTSNDLENWKRIPDAIYGDGKYVGGPALYYEGDWYYTLYLESLGNGRYETRITRSKDLIHWQDAPVDRPFLTFDSSRSKMPLHPPDAVEINASDAELCYFGGRTIVYFTGGNQLVCGDLQRAEFAGTPRELFEKFFSSTTAH